METNQINRFKELLSVPSKTYAEEKMVEYICEVLETIDGVSFYRDSVNNIYATKGGISEGEYYPLFLSHTDTVHSLVDEIVVKEEYLYKPTTFGKSFDDFSHRSLKAYTKTGEETGIGGDDKAGIFICLELLRTLPTLKVAFFVSEETGCHGSSRCDLDFLQDVGYAVQFDAPGNHLITEICSGVRLYEKDGDFIKTIREIYESVFGFLPMEQSHPYTDVSQLKIKGDFTCINFSCGYYNMHTSKEFVVLSDVDLAMKLGEKIYNKIGLKKIPFSYQSKFVFPYASPPWDVADDTETEEFVYNISDLVVTENEYGFTIEDSYTNDNIILTYADAKEFYEILKTYFED